MQEGLLSTARRNGSGNITAVILDYGKVLVRSPTTQEFGRMAEMFNVSFESFYQLWENSRGPYDCGDLTAEEYWLNLAQQTNTSLDGGQIKILRQVEVEIWAHTNSDMLQWVNQLHAAGIKTALLSNMPWDLVKYVRANCHWMENFSFKTFSAEERLIKPDPAIYEHTLRGLGVTAAEALFVDDREVNVEAARALGIRSIRFQSTAQLKNELEVLGFPILPAAAESSEVSDAAASRSEAPGQEIKFQL
jgi:putative hydrolase of the HAD superfamily